MVLHYQEIRLEIQGLPGLGQAEKKLVPIRLLLFEISMRLLSSWDTLKPSLLGLFIPGWMLNLSYITLNPYPPAWSQLWASVAHWESGYMRTLVASCKSAPPPPPSLQHSGQRSSALRGRCSGQRSTWVLLVTFQSWFWTICLFGGRNMEARTFYFFQLR